MKAIVPSKKPRIKNHVTAKGKALNSQLSAKFGITLKDFEKACMGDLATIQRIGELNRQAEFMRDYAPKLKDAYLTIIQGTETYNLALADILKASGSASLRISKAMDSTALADRKYRHGRTEQARQYLADRTAENQRHQYQLNYQQVKGYMDAFLIDVDRQAAILDQSNRPEIKQRIEDKNFQRRAVDEYLEYGDDARLDLLPNKNYRGIKDRIRGLFESLGF